MKDTKMKDLKIFDENGKALHIGVVMASFLKAYDTDILQIEIDRKRNVIEVAKCTESDDYYADYDYDYMDDINLP